MKLVGLMCAVALTPDPKHHPALTAVSDSPSLPSQPGAGQNPVTAKSEEAEVRKDGFQLVKCVNEGMHVTSDNQSGQGQKRYSPGFANVSVIWYDKTVAKEEREEMTPTVCFNFCRIQKRMGFFGLLNGRDCYCTPYFQAVAGNEDEDCDIPCDGDKTQICGGRTKSSVYSMHFCNDIEDDAERAFDLADKNAARLESLEEYNRCARRLEEQAKDQQQIANHFGAHVISNQFQLAKVEAQRLKELDRESSSFRDELEMLSAEPKGTAIEKQEGAEAQVIQLQGWANRASEFYKEAKEEFAATCDAPPPNPEVEAEFDNAEDCHAGEYCKVEYYTESKGSEASTCEGDLIGHPRFVTHHECGLKCQETIFPERCESFGFFEPLEKSGKGGSSGICLLFSNVKKIHLFFCKEKNAFLQDKAPKHEAPTHCYLRLSDSKGFKPEEKLYKDVEC